MSCMALHIDAIFVIVMRSISTLRVHIVEPPKVNTEIKELSKVALVAKLVNSQRHNSQVCNTAKS